MPALTSVLSTTSVGSMAAALHTQPLTSSTIVGTLGYTGLLTNVLGTSATGTMTAAFSVPLTSVLTTMNRGLLTAVKASSRVSNLVGVFASGQQGVIGRLPLDRKEIYSLILQESSTSGDAETIRLDQVGNFGVFGDVISVGATVHYSIENGNNKETGYGTYTQNRLLRTRPLTTLENGVYDSSSPNRITLSGISSVSIAPMAQTFTNLEEDAKLRVLMLMGSS